MSIGALVAVPELQADGPARLLSLKTGYLVIRFLASGAEMTKEQREVVRYCLLPGTKVKATVGSEEIAGEITATRLQRDASGLVIYGFRKTADGADGEIPVREDAITALPEPTDPVERLATVAFNDTRPVFAKAGTAMAPEPWGPQTFCAREDLLDWREASWAVTGGVTGLSGARVRPLPHQLLAARTALADRQVRFLFADEVGLGKTIEAGLVVQSLLAMQPNLRVLIVVPGALVSQWFLELFVKFGGRSFLMLDGERLRSYEGNPWADQQFVLASSRAVEELDAKGALHLAKSKWDVLIVDECHRMQPGGLLYKRVAVLSKGTPHVLLLSATPARQHADAYLALLALLQPQVYRNEDLASFSAKLAAHDQVVELLARTLAAGASDAATLAEAWLKLLGADPLLAGFAARLKEGGDAFAAARDRLVDYVREHYQLDRRIIRNRRQVLARLSQASGVKGLALTSRSLELVRYTPEATELAVRTALADYQRTLVAAAAGAVPPRLAHWLLQLELAAATHPLVLERMLAMRAAVLESPGDFAPYRARATKGETTAHVLRSDLSENEIASHVAVSAACNCDPTVETDVLAALTAATAAWHKHASGASAARFPARLKALIERLKRFWTDHPQEKVLIFTGHGLAVKPLAAMLGKAFGEGCVETFGAHQDTLAREDAARRFQDDDRCSLLICDPLGGEGRNFQFVSAVVHHDLPWSVAAVEQRIGRVDRLGRDGDVPSWVLVGDQAACTDAAWAELLEQAVGVFTHSSSGLEFICDALECRALDAVFAGGAAGLRGVIGELTALVAKERDARDLREDECFHADASDYLAAAKLSEAIAAAPVPVGAITRWIRGMGGAARREDEPPRAWQLRTRYHQQPEDGVFDRETALARPQLSFFSLGNGVIDQLLDDAAQARWCTATAWRRLPGPGCGKWDGLRVVVEFALDLGALVAAGLRLDVLRRLLVVVPPRRQVVFVRLDDGVVETDAKTIAALAPGFDSRRGDTSLSPQANRDAWTRRLLAGESPKIAEWQVGVRRAAAAALAHAQAALPARRDAALAALDAHLAHGLAAAQAVAVSAIARLGADRPDAVRAKAEADDEAKQVEALRQVIAGGTLEITSAAYIAVT